MDIELEDLNKMENRKGDTSSRMGLAKGSRDSPEKSLSELVNTDKKSEKGMEHLSNSLKKDRFQSPRPIQIDEDQPELDIPPEEVKRKGADVVKKKKSKPAVNFFEEKDKDKLKALNLFDKFAIENKIQNEKMFNFLNNQVTQLFLLILTFYALFADDYRLLTSPKSLDLIYDIITILAIASFTAEIIVSIFAKVGYFGSSFFWLDTISSISLILDVIMIKEWIIEAGRSGALPFTKLGKVIRLIRLFRLIRISKVFKSISSENEQENAPVRKKSKKDSKVGRRLSELATKIVIFTCFLLLILLPFFDAEFWLRSPEAIAASCFQFRIMLNYDYAQQTDFNAATYSSNQADVQSSHQDQLKHFNYYLSKVVEEYQSNGPGKILMVDFPNTQATYYLTGTFSDYRKEETLKESCFYGPNNEFEVIVYQDNMESITLGAIINIIRTFFVSALLLGGSLLFGRDIYTLVINPIERMIEKVTEVIERPQKTKEKAFIEAEEREMKLLQKKDFYWEDVEEDGKKKKKEELETHIIENAIRKIGVLMGIGLGEAGSGLIKNYLGSEGDVDIMMPGEMTEAVFGFCDIRNFTDATEILEEEVMLFVNRIADIVHYVTDRHLGTSNKNVGDAFLLVWKCPRGIAKVKKIEHMGEDDVIKTNIADLALFGFMKMFAEINRAPSLKTYSENKDIQARLGPNYKVRLGIGIHYGWAVEGAIGSYHKVDASYLSPNVNMSMKLEEMTKEYGTPILLSGEFVDCLSEFAKKLCRMIDVVKIKGKTGPLKVYTPNISDRAIKFPDFQPLKNYTSKLKDTYAFKKLLKREILKGTFVGPPLFQNDPDIPLLMCFNDDEFLEYFNTAIQCYARGEWEMAKDFLEKAKKIKPKDGPTRSIYEYMKSNVFEEPENWDGSRTLK